MSSRNPGPGIQNPRLQCGYNAFLHCIRAMKLDPYINAYLGCKKNKNNNTYNFMEEVSDALNTIRGAKEQNMMAPVACPINIKYVNLTEHSKHFDILSRAFFNTGVLEIYEVIPGHYESTLKTLREETPNKLFISIPTRDYQSTHNVLNILNYDLVSEFWHTGGFHFVARVKLDNQWYIYDDTRVYSENTEAYNQYYESLKRNKDAKIEVSGYIRIENKLSAKNKSDHRIFMTKPYTDPECLSSPMTTSSSQLTEAEKERIRGMSDEERLALTMKASLSLKGGKAFKKTDEKKHILGRERLIYKGLYGKKYIKSKDQFIAVASIK